MLWSPFIQGLSPEVVERVTGVMHKAWIRFIRDGDPNPEGTSPWRPYAAEDCVRRACVRAV